MDPDLIESPDTFKVESDLTTQPRLDAYLAVRYPSFSRVGIQGLIEAEAVTVNDRQMRPSYRIRAGDVISVSFPDLPDRPERVIEPEDIPLDVVYEDEWLTVINKPPNMVVHPGKGNWKGTLVNALQYRYSNLSSVSGTHRPGIIHRLDRDTTGLVLVGRDDETHRGLASQFEKRTIEKNYIAVVYGEPSRDRDFIEQPIGPHSSVRERMAIKPVTEGGKDSKTFYEVVRRYGKYSIVKCELHTGRTHQIRVHLAYVGTPVVADKLYACRDRITLSEIKGLAQPGSTVEGEEPLITRQALHAHTIAFIHPKTGKRIELEAPIPADMVNLIEALEKLPPAPAVTKKGRF